MSTARPLWRRVAALLVPVLRVLASAWILAYYFVPGTRAFTISPGALIAERCVLWSANVRIAGICALAIAAVATLWCRDRKAPVTWLLAAAYLLPALVTLPTGYGGVDGQAASLVCALCTGMVAARIAGRGIGAVMVVMGVVAASYAIVGYRAHTGVIVSGHTLRAGGLFRDPNQLLALLLASLPFAAAGALPFRRSAGCGLYSLATAAEFAALVLAWFRSAALGLAVAAPAFLSMRGRSPRATVVSLVACAVLFGVTAGVRSGDRVNEASTDRSNRSRMTQLRAGWRAFLSAPIGGVGIGGLAIPVVVTPGGTPINTTSTHPKNVLLHVLVERGLAGGLLFAALAASVTVILRRAMPDPLAMACASAWLALLGAGMVDTTFGDGCRYAGNCCAGILLGATMIVARRGHAIEPSTGEIVGHQAAGA